MTFFLNSEVSQTPRGPDALPSTTAQAWGAGITRSWRESNVAMQRERQVVSTRDYLAEQAAARLGMEGIMPIIEERNRFAAENGMNSQIIHDIPTDPMEAASLLGPSGSKAIIDLARERAAADPQAWADIDLTDAGVEAQVTARRLAEQADEDLIFSMTQSGGQLIAGQVGGGIVGAFVDPINIALAPFGGGAGSLLRVMGREAALGAAAEAISLPARFKVADELGNAAPDISDTLLMGAAGGAILGGAVSGIGRAIAYFKAPRETPAVAGMTPLQVDDAVSVAENAMVQGADPVEAVLQKLPQMPPRVQEPREPLVLSNPSATPLLPTEPNFNASAPSASDVAAVPSPDAQIKPYSNPGLAAALKAARAADSRAKRPLTKFLSKPERGLQIDPDGPLGQELRARDITPSTTRGLFRRGGRQELDNLVASEMEADFPGIIDATGTRPGDNYIDYDGLRQLLARDASGDASWLRTRQDVERLKREIEEDRRLAESPSAVAELPSVTPDDRFVVNPVAREMFDADEWDANLREGLNEYLGRKFSGTTFTKAETDELFEVLRTQGGDADDLAMSILSRDVDYLELDVGDAVRYAEFDDAAFQRYMDEADASRVFGPDQQGAGQSQQISGTARGGPAGEGNGAALFEPTAAGSQSLISGVAPITTADRLTARQNAPLSGGSRRSDTEIGGLFDPGDKARTDLFDNPASSVARPIQDSMVQDLRERLEIDGDVTLSIDGQDVSLAALIDDLDADDEFAAQVALCGRPA